MRSCSPAGWGGLVAQHEGGESFVRPHGPGLCTGAGEATAARRLFNEPGYHHHPPPAIAGSSPPHPPPKAAPTSTTRRHRGTAGARQQDDRVRGRAKLAGPAGPRAGVVTGTDGAAAARRPLPPSTTRGTACAGRARRARGRRDRGHCTRPRVGYVRSRAARRHHQYAMDGTP